MSWPPCLRLDLNWRAISRLFPGRARSRPRNGGDSHVEADPALRPLCPGCPRYARVWNKSQLAGCLFVEPNHDTEVTPMLKLTLRYGRYVLAALATLGFGTTYQ